MERLGLQTSLGLKLPATLACLSGIIVTVLVDVSSLLSGTICIVGYSLALKEKLDPRLD
jgi:hypothetical protein